MRLIDADALKKILAENSLEYAGKDIVSVCMNTAYLLAINSVHNAPTIDAAPVVHGHWVEKELFIPWCDDDVDIIYECSCCRTESGGTSPYCPNCGAKMDGGGEK